MNEKYNCRSIAIYGKGGIGKSTIASNLSASLSLQGEKVMQIGCDPKRDSVSLLCGGLIPSILDNIEDERSEGIMDKVIKEGFNGVLCAESGGPKPGTGCAGKGVVHALEFLQMNDVLRRYEVTYALYDILGDVVCGGFAQPLRDGFAEEVYVVTSGELFSLIQLNNICMSIYAISEGGANCRLQGIINNMRGIPFEKEIVAETAKMMGVPVLAHIPRSQTVQDSEKRGETVIEAFPASAQAQVYIGLADKIQNNEASDTAYFRPLSSSEIRTIVRQFSPKAQDVRDY